MDQDNFKQAVKTLGVEINDCQYFLFAKLCSLLMIENTKKNLTAIKEENAIYQKHFIDSLSCALAASFTHSQKVLDVGSGAGFPALPLSICFPQCTFIALEANGKKADFISLAIKELGLSNLQSVKGRAEEIAYCQSFRENFDIVLGRAVAKTAVLAELCLPFVKISGLFIAQKACFAAGEIAEGQKAVNIMGGRLENSRKVIIGNESRLLVSYRKVKSTPDKYPRRSGLPVKEPIK
ncbi:MAG: 16S rRNA (guanine(527)-N(7))-methyltransferase RsmG [Chloroflexi bacterium]|nr:16S rRNA (guanine(527)-N(7))-methyltransferase RsmG [Chloroflexota bacterium]